VDAPGYGKNIYSIGDFVLFGGVALVITQVLAEAVTAARKPATS
jgi:tRNA G37 N-methylase TrmD